MMWHVAPLSTSHLRRGSPTPIDWNFSNKLISSTRWDSFSATGPSFLEVPDSHSFTHMVICSWICLTDPPALGSASGSGWSSPWSSSSYSSSYSWSSCSSSPSTPRNLFPFPLPFVFLPPFPLPLPLPPGLVGWALAFGLAVGFLSGCFSQQSCAKWPSWPQWLHFLGSGQFSAKWPYSCTFPGRFLIYSKYWSPSLMRTSCSWAAITEASNIEWKDSISVCTSLTMSGKWSDFLTRNLMHWSRYPKASDLESRENSFLIKRRSSKPFDSVMPKAEIWLLIKFSILLYPVKFCWSKWKSLLLLMVWSWSLKDRIGSAELMASLSSGP